MKQQDKELLLKDLCARLPYMPKIKITYQQQGIKGTDEGNVSCDVIEKIVNDLRNGVITDMQIYLRPISSMTEKEAKELLFIRLASKYGESCAYIKNFSKLYEVSFRTEPPYVGSIAVWFSFENESHEGPQMREYGQLEYLGRINDITLAEIDWFNAHHFDYRDLIPMGLAIEVTKENNPYENNH